MFLLRRKAKTAPVPCPPAYALHPGVFREEQVCRGKVAYYFLYDNDRFSDPDHKFFLQTQLLANLLLSGMSGYVFYVQLFVNATRHIASEEITALAHWKDEKDIDLLSGRKLGPSLQEFTFFTRNLNAVSQNTILTPGKNLDGVMGVFADYYAIRPSVFREELLCSSEQIKADADFALISDDTHAVWTILHTEEYPQNLLEESLEKFCSTYSAKLHTYV